MSPSFPIFISLLFHSTHSISFTPIQSDPITHNAMWDIYYTADPKQPTTVHMHYLVNSTIFPPASFVSGDHWYNGLGHAVSYDSGVHW